MRLFISIPLPSECKQVIAEKIKTIVPFFRGRDIRWIPEEKWHITLVFLGNQPEEAVSVIKEAIRSVHEEIAMDRTKIRFDRIALGPTENRARMIWVFLAEESRMFLGNVKEKISRPLRDSGIRWRDDFREFNGHVTLARFPELRSQNRAVANEMRKIQHIDCGFLFTEIDLMRSILSRNGSVYEKL